MSKEEECLKEYINELGKIIFIAENCLKKITNISYHIDISGNASAVSDYSLTIEDLKKTLEQYTKDTDKFFETIKNNITHN
jgi:hypothetical protein